MACSNVQSNNSDDNLGTYSIFWLDALVHNEENKGAQKQLRSIINQLRTFVDPEEFMDRVRYIRQGDLTILIVSGKLGRTIVPEMQKLQQISSIYVYCFDKEANEQSSRPYSKVRTYSYLKRFHWIVAVYFRLKLFVTSWMNSSI
ncbi:unnamed protein product [Rotaria sp. Silwood2]|nr:unnamed protein product [Rotaria sp. Silwood2]CAF4345300.1 unnamed protein product [Rotaria sp. Silwood2]